LKIPQEWIEEALQLICNKEIPISLRPSMTRIEKEIDNYINSDFNEKWNSPLNDNFKGFFISIIVSQCHPYAHGLTCGVDSAHSALVPRITSNGKTYLVCPTCGFIQEGK
jgi:hypothetical protein